MEHKLTRFDWLKTLWKIVTNPTLEVLAAIVVVLAATWYLVDSDPVIQHPHAQVLFGNR